MPPAFCLWPNLPPIGVAPGPAWLTPAKANNMGEGSFFFIVIPNLRGARPRPLPGSAASGGVRPGRMNRQTSMFSHPFLASLASCFSVVPGPLWSPGPQLCPLVLCGTHYKFQFKTLAQILPKYDMCAFRNKFYKKIAADHWFLVRISPLKISEKNWGVFSV